MLNSYNGFVIISAENLQHLNVVPTPVPIPLILLRDDGQEDDGLIAQIRALYNEFSS
jgi:hypothetical protein